MMARPWEALVLSLVVVATGGCASAEGSGGKPGNDMSMEDAGSQETANGGTGGDVVPTAGGDSPQGVDPIQNDMSEPEQTTDHVVPPILRDGRYVFEMGATALEVSPDQGGRITDFSFDGTNVLTGSEVDAVNWGSTFWTSPQSDWNWPPVAAVDSDAYSARVQDDTLVMEGSPADLAGTQIAIEKQLTGYESGKVQIRYFIHNVGGAAVSVAPWEVSRVKTGGLTFFAVGPGGTQTPSGAGALPVQEQDSVVYFDEPTAGVADGTNSKLNADAAEGWVAHASAEDILFVKSFQDVAQGSAAPGEGEVEIFTAGRYVEVENQGAQAVIEAGTSIEYAVLWQLSRIAAADRYVGSPGLLAMARQLAGLGAAK